MAKKDKIKDEVILDEVILDEAILDEAPKMEAPKLKTEIVKEKGQMGWYKGRHYKVLNGANGVGQWGDTGECFAICDLLEENKKNK